MPPLHVAAVALELPMKAVCVISDGGGLRDVVAIHVEGHAGVEKIHVGVGAKGVGVGHLNGVRQCRGFEPVP